MLTIEERMQALERFALTETDGFVVLFEDVRTHFTRADWGDSQRTLCGQSLRHAQRIVYLGDVLEDILPETVCSGCGAIVLEGE